MSPKSKGLQLGLTKTRTSLLGKISSLFRGTVHQESLWDDLEEALIGTDMGVEVVVDALNNVQRTIGRVVDQEAILQNLKKEILKNLLSTNRELNSSSTPPTVILVVGVNGVGKTLTTAKLAYKLKNRGNKVLLAASDTFRAAAIEQLGVLSKRIGIKMIKHSYGSDPAAVAFDATEAARARGVDFLIIDTAGRSHTEKHLMERAKKIARVLNTRFPSSLSEILLILDATTGQNALSQAQAFIELMGVTGIALTKLDGTAKGGIVVAIERELKIPVKFVGTGENLEALEVFDPEVFVSSLFEG
ncbi:MAG TPA: signal recognition particle-docking protein FtsY [Candidatus Omnitrophica bacterium]|nr:signal recognition particle-docking protein FtsY [Candidatus Omnitrophota bacterium]